MITKNISCIVIGIKLTHSIPHEIPNPLFRTPGYEETIPPEEQSVALNHKLMAPPEVQVSG